MLAILALFNHTGNSSSAHNLVSFSGSVTIWLAPQHVPCKYLDATSMEATKIR